MIIILGILNLYQVKEYQAIFLAPYSRILNRNFVRRFAMIFGIYHSDFDLFQFFLHIRHEPCGTHRSQMV